jgi:formylglycine-generating enzyme required for sulfatase activity
VKQPATTACVIALASAFVLPTALADVPPSYGYEFVTVGDPGNRPSNASEDIIGFDRQIGAVDYTFRIARTETTVEQWIEFAEAYAPYYEHPFGGVIPLDTYRGYQVTSNIGTNPVTGIRLRNGFQMNEAVSVGWEYAARYANWLHNDKSPEQWAFESGVYDTSTFTINDDGTLNHQNDPAPGARFWIPSRDEWAKAAYWDPDKNGPGEGGYWQFPHGSDDDLAHSLLATEGGERNAGPDDVFPLPVGSFPHVQSPWGVLDMAGGQREWTSALNNAENAIRVKGTPWTDIPADNLFGPDRLAYAVGANTQSFLAGFRLASSIPAPGTAAVVALGVVLLARRHQ